MQPDKEKTAQDFLEEVRKIPDPKERLERLERSEFKDEPGVVAAKAWWEARYHFVDKKKTHAGDRFLWFLLNLRVWTNNASTAKGKHVASVYKEVFLSPETERAIALENRLEEEMQDACVLYISTIDLNPGFLGFRLSKAPKGGEDAVKRIAVIVGNLMAGMYTVCAQLQYSDVVVRSLWKGAEQAYPGIADILEAMVQNYDDQQMRDFVLNAINPT